MIIGNPYTFAFIVDKVPEWSDNSFKNGIFLVSINGVIFPPELATATLNTDLYYFFEVAPSSLITMPINNTFFNMDKVKLFSILYNSVSSRGLTQCNKKYNFNGNKFKFSTTSMEDEGCYCFSICNGKKLRVIGANVKKKLSVKADECASFFVSEIEVDIQYMKEKLKELKKFYQLEIA